MNCGFTITVVVSNFRDELEFMLVAKRDSVMRIDLNNFNSVEILPLPRVRSVIAIDYDMRNNCLYWSDVNRDHIMRLHLDGMSEPEHLVSSGLKSVEGLAYDWIAHNLYFSDGKSLVHYMFLSLKFAMFFLSTCHLRIGAEAKIEVIRTDSHTLGRMRKTVVKRPEVEKPRGLVVHPVKGYYFSKFYLFVKL